MKYVLIGPEDPEGEDNLYWSNEWGWGTFDGCTQFDGRIFNTPLPVETQAIGEIMADGTIGKLYPTVVGEREK